MRVVKCDRGGMVEKNWFREYIQDGVKGYFEQVNERWGLNGGGDKKLEIYGGTRNDGPIKERQPGVAL